MVSDHGLITGTEETPGHRAGDGFWHGTGITTNQHRDSTNGNHPGYTLARRLAAKAKQVWTFTRNLAVPWTNNL
jgi:hypothetical protein